MGPWGPWTFTAAAFMEVALMAVWWPHLRESCALEGMKQT